MILNFGHTVGHALEAATSYRRFKHGEAVAWGMIAALQYGRQQGFTPADNRVEKLIGCVGKLPSLKDISIEKVWVSLEHDKKFAGGKFVMILLPRIGQAAIVSGQDARAFRRFLKSFLGKETKR
jgi:3-dehydroquinate synthase